MDEPASRLPLRWPRFDDPAEEARFRADHDASTRRWIAGHAPILVAIVLASVVIEVAMFPPRVWLPVSGLLLAFIALPVFVTWRLARREAPGDRVYRAVVATAASASFGVVAIVAWPRSQGLPQPYEGILLVMMSIFVLSGLRARDASAITFLGVLGVLLLETCWPTSAQDAVAHLSFAVGVHLLGSVFALELERGKRRDFRHRATLQALAQHDPLTGALNRRGLDARWADLAAMARRENAPVALAVVDVDHFKAYNDHYGHEGGDAVLVAVSAALARQARRPLDLCARLGGEEFVLAWYDVDATRALALGEEARAAVAALALPHAATQAGGVVTVSVGIAAADGAAGFEALYRDADAALYTAKRGGRNRVCAAAAGA